MTVKASPESRSAARAKVHRRVAGKSPRTGRPIGRRKVADELAPALPSVRAALCPTCEEPYSDGAGWCKSCGGDLKSNVCKTSGCGRTLPDGAKFCEGCGKPRPAPPPKSDLDEVEQEEDEADGAPVNVVPEVAMVPPAPAPPPAKPRRPPFNPVAIGILYKIISNEMEKRKMTPLTEEEREECAEDLAELLAFYVKLDPKYEVLVRCAFTHVAVFVPRIFVLFMVERRKEREAERKKAEDEAARKRASEPATPAVGAGT